MRSFTESEDEARTHSTVLCINPFRDKPDFLEERNGFDVTSLKYHSARVNRVIPTSNEKISSLFGFLFAPIRKWLSHVQLEINRTCCAANMRACLTFKRILEFSVSQNCCSGCKHLYTTIAWVVNSEKFFNSTYKSICQKKEY